MHVFQRHRPFKTACTNFFKKGGHPFFNGLKVFFREKAHMAEHLGMGERALNINLCKPLVKAHRGSVALHQLRNRLSKAARPGFIFLFKEFVMAALHCGNYVDYRIT